MRRKNTIIITAVDNTGETVQVYSPTGSSMTYRGGDGKRLAESLASPNSRHFKICMN